MTDLNEAILECLSGTAPGMRVTILPGGVRTFRLRRDGADAGTVSVSWTDGQLRLANRSTRTIALNQQPVGETAALCDNDRLTIGGDVFIVHLPKEPDTEDMGGLEVIEPPVGRESGRDSGISGREPATENRRRRAISASASASTSQRPGLLTRMSAALASRQDRHRHELLLRERRDLLEEAGRLALTGEHLGLPLPLIARLRAGETVTISPREVNRAALEQWHQLSSRLNLVDAELATLRRVLHLAPEQATPAVSGRLAMREREEKVFAELDGHATQELTALDGGPTERVEKPR